MDTTSGKILHSQAGRRKVQVYINKRIRVYATLEARERAQLHREIALLHALVLTHEEIGSESALIDGEKKYSPPREMMNAGTTRSWFALRTSTPDTLCAEPSPG
jgi:hypothetical protein